MKLAYNLTAFALGTEVALMLFHLGARTNHLVVASTIVAASAAALLASLIGILSVFLAIAITDGTQARGERVQGLVFGMSASAVTTSMVLVGFVLQQTEPAVAWLLALPLIGVYVAERAFVGQIRDRRRLQFLHRSTVGAAELGRDNSVSSLLLQLCHIFPV
jgi:hypothetical protein